VRPSQPITWFDVRTALNITATKNTKKRTQPCKEIDAQTKPNETKLLLRAFMPTGQKHTGLSVIKSY